jgi:hypothetical protein
MPSSIYESIRPLVYISSYPILRLKHTCIFLFHEHVIGSVTYLAMPHEASPCPTISRHVPPYLITSHNVPPCPSMSHNVAQYRAMSHHWTTCQTSFSYRKLVLQMLTNYFRLTLLSMAYYNTFRGIFLKSGVERRQKVKRQDCGF